MIKDWAATTQDLTSECRLQTFREAVNYESREITEGWSERAGGLLGFAEFVPDVMTLLSNWDFFQFLTPTVLRPKKNGL